MKDKQDNDAILCVAYLDATQLARLLATARRRGSKGIVWAHRVKLSEDARALRTMLVLRVRPSRSSRTEPIHVVFRIAEAHAGDSARARDLLADADARPWPELAARPPAVLRLMDPMVVEDPQVIRRLSRVRCYGSPMHLRADGIGL